MKYDGGLAAPVGDPLSVTVYGPQTAYATIVGRLPLLPLFFTCIALAVQPVGVPVCGVGAERVTTA